MCPLILAPVRTLILPGLGQQLHLSRLPDIFGHQPLMQAVYQQVVVLLHKAVVVPCPVDLLSPPPSIGDFAAVDRIFQNHADKAGIKQGIFPVLSLNFADTVVFQIFCYSVRADIGSGVLLENDPNCLRFFFIDFQFAIHQAVAVRSKTAVPSTLSGFLNTALHGLDTDIFTLDFGHSGENGNHQLSCILGGINTVLHTDQIHTKILHNLQGGENIGGVPAES